VKDPDSRSVTDGDQGNALSLHVVVEVLLNIDRDGTGALIQDGVLGFVVEETSHGDTLFFTSGKYIVPVVLGVPSSLTLDELTKSDILQEYHKVFVSLFLGLHLFKSVGVDKLIAESSIGKVGTLGNIEDLVNGGLVDDTTSSGPEFTQNTEERTFTASVGASNHQVHAGLNPEAHLIDESITVGRDNGDILEHDVVGLDEGGLSLKVLEADNFIASLLLRGSGSFTRFFLGDHDTLVSTDLEVIKDIIHLVDERGVTSKRLDFLVRNHESTDSFSQVN